MIYQLLVPALLAVLLSLHLGYAWSHLALPVALQPCRWLLMPLLGLALLLLVTAALTVFTPLRPLEVALGLALLALPLNGWLVWRDAGGRTENRESGTEEQPGRTAAQDGRTRDSPVAWFLHHRQSPIVHWTRPGALAVVGCWLCALVVFMLAVLPAARWGVSTPIGDNWDAAEFYVPLGRALELVSQRDIGLLPRNPLVTIFTTPPVSGRIHAFSYLHATISSVTGIEPLRSFVPLMAFVLALQPLALFPLARVVGLGRGAALLAAVLLALAWLPLWVTYNSFSNHVIALPFLPVALAASIVALRDGGRAALCTAALFTAALATAYYPAISAYVLMLGPVALYLALGRHPDSSAHITPQITGLRTQGVRLFSLALLALLFSPAAQVYFFLREGFLGEMLRSGGGYQVFRFVPLTDMLGLSATFRNERLPGDPRLVLPALALLLLLGLVALLRGRVPLLVAACLGVAAYQGYTYATGYHYGFYKGATFAIPMLILLVVAGAARLLQSTRPSFSHIVRAGTLAAVALVLLLNAHTIWRVQENYTAAGPRLWSIAETDVVQVRALVPPEASVLVIPTGASAPIFNSLMSYVLLGHQVYGNFATGYNAIRMMPEQQVPDLALLPQGVDPSGYGYRDEEVRWAGAGMRLYGRAPDVLYHRSFGGGGRFPALAPGESLLLQVAPEQIALPGEELRAPEAPQTARVALSVASFAPTQLELFSSASSRTYDLPGGLTELISEPLALPDQLRIENRGESELYLWVGELRDATGTVGLIRDDEAFVQVLPRPLEGTRVQADLRLFTEQLPRVRQKLTALLVVSHSPQGTSEWFEIGQWVFFPNDTAPLQIDLNLDDLHATLARDGQPLDFFGSAQPGDDGQYRAALLFANNAQIIYGTTIWAWQVREGAVEDVFADAVVFDVLPLPRAATVLNRPSVDGLIRLHGYTLPQRTTRPGENLVLSLVWQSLDKLGADLQARVQLHDAVGTLLAEQTAPLGRPDHGTSIWQEGELAEQTFTLPIPASASTGPARLTVELYWPDGHMLALGNSADPVFDEIFITR